MGAAFMDYPMQDDDIEEDEPPLQMEPGSSYSALMNMEPHPTGPMDPGLGYPGPSSITSQIMYSSSQEMQEDMEAEDKPQEGRRSSLGLLLAIVATVANILVVAIVYASTF
uniref:uncharacterized protein C14orf132 homolog n=1 Tax=Myxine glutinosa TaxID=7769 RepID=UPI00358EE970